MRLVQLAHGSVRRVAAVDGAQLHLLREPEAPTIYALARTAIDSGRRLTAVAEDVLTSESLDYEPIYECRSDWRILLSFDHPADPAHCMVSGAGLTHKKSAENRSAMHGGAAAGLTDSMRMYQLGVEGGNPAPGQLGAQPEWFYKGDGTVLKAHGEPLTVPAYAGDGGEEPEIAAAYLIAPTGEPLRIGYTIANEFSDHLMEKKNYLYLAHSKLRECAIGPELTIGDQPFEDVPGAVQILRRTELLWSKQVWSGQKNMSHSLTNSEHHHFKYQTHRRPGDVHIHFFGADAFSFGDGLLLEEGDWMEISFPLFGRPLRNPLTRLTPPETLVMPRLL